MEKEIINNKWWNEAVRKGGRKLKCKTRSELVNALIQVYLELEEQKKKNSSLADEVLRLGGKVTGG